MKSSSSLAVLALSRFPLLDRLSWRVLAAAGAGLLVVLALGVAAWLWSANREHRASMLYADGLARLQSSGQPQAPPEAREAAIRDLEAALARYPSATMAAQAASELGNVHYEQREYDRARRMWQIALAGGAPETVRSLARAGIAAAWEAEGDLPKAIETYRAALAEPGTQSFLYEQLLLDLGRAQERAGQQSEAIETYRRFLKELGTSPRADAVRGRLAALGATP